MLAKFLAACTNLSSTVSQLFEPKVQKIAVFTYRSPHFCFPWRRPCNYQQYVSWIERQFNACQTPRCMYLYIFNSYRDMRCLIQCVSPKIAIFTTFLFPLGTPRGNRAKCCMGGKKIRCLQIVSQHVYPSIFNSFPVRITFCKCKKRHFHVPQPTFLFPLETPLQLSRNMLHGWKDNSMLANSSRMSAFLYIQLY